MSGYIYKVEREKLLTDEGQRLFLKIRDRVQYLLQTAGAFRMMEAFIGIGGDSWQMIACIERMVELKEIVECSNPASRATQHSVYTNYTSL